MAGMPAKGVRYTFDDRDLADLKRSVLLFPTLYVGNLELYREPDCRYTTIETKEIRLPVTACLSAAGALARIPDHILEALFNKHEYLRTKHDAIRHVDPEIARRERALSEQRRNNKVAQINLLHEGRALAQNVEVDIRSREAAIRLEQSLGQEFVPFVKSMKVVETQPASRENLLHVVLKRLPLPDDDTPWEAILEWRNDVDAKEKYRRIVLAIADAARSGKPSRDFDDEIATKLDDYRRAMFIHHKRMATSKVEIFFVTTAEIIEHLAHLRFVGAIKSLIDLQYRQLDLLEAEGKAPGREFAYIASAAEHFA